MFGWETRSTRRSSISPFSTAGPELRISGPLTLGPEHLDHPSESWRRSIQQLRQHYGRSTSPTADLASPPAPYGAEAEFDPYHYLPGTDGLAVDGLTVYYYAAGGNISLSEDTTFDHVSVTNDPRGYTSTLRPGSRPRRSQ